MNSNLLFLTHQKNKSRRIPRIHINVNAPNTTTSSSKTKNKWIILLTMAINVGNECECRKQLYKTQLLNWLQYTDYYIYVIESTGVDLNIFNITHERLKYVSFELHNAPSSSQSEAISILHILNNIKNDPNYIECTHILKVTGRYFLHNINNVLNKCVQDLDAYVQHHYNHHASLSKVVVATKLVTPEKWQNTEYYGIRKGLIEEFLLSVINEGVMERKFYDFIIKNKLTFMRIGPFKNNIKRGGDKVLIRNL
jgi:hypothetical protein